MNTDISVIIPLYKGEPYIKRLLEMLKRNNEYKGFNQQYTLEIIFVNDFPEQRVEIQDNLLNIRVINNIQNQGIHQSRVNGIKEASGKYIILLDQDDLIKDSCLYSQIQTIQHNKGDFCVCKGWLSRFRTIGSTSNYEEQINDIDGYFQIANPIISPGQVIMRRERIPNEWLENVQRKNGADDYLLWILVLLKGGRFILNEEYLYYHTPERTDDSIGTNAMIDSIREMQEILKSLGYLTEEREKKLEELIWEMGIIDGNAWDIEGHDMKRFASKTSYITKFRKMFFVLLEWGKIRNQGKTIESYLIKNSYHSIAIQGMGYIGELLYEELKDSSIDVKYAIDKTAMDFKEELKVLKLEDELPEVDLMISTILSQDSRAVDILATKGNVMRIGNIIQNLKMIEV